MQSVIQRLIIVVLMLKAVQVNAQQDDLFIPRNIQKAYQNKTRNLQGEPGSKFWKNYAEYYIRVSFDPKTLKIKVVQDYLTSPLWIEVNI